MQREAILRASKARGSSIDKWFSEKASSVNERPELARLRELARAGAVEKLYVFKLDRLSRSGVLEMLNIVHELRRNGCAVETIADGFSFDGPWSDLILAVFACVAQMERAAIIARLDHARVELEASGGHWGRPPKWGRLDALRMKKMNAEGRSVREISVALKCSKTTVQNLLSRKYPPKSKKKSKRKTALKPRQK